MVGLVPTMGRWLGPEKCRRWGRGAGAENREVWPERVRNGAKDWQMGRVPCGGSPCGRCALRERVVSVPLTAVGVSAISSLLGVQAGVDVRVTLRAAPLFQVHRQVRLAQLRDEIVRHRDPPAHPGAVAHLVPLTIFDGILACMAHG
jgi:hypothetical protein